MSEWINVKDKLPPVYEIVWIYWRDREVLLGCKTAEDSEPSECWFSFDDDKCRWTNWWMPHKDSPCDKPHPPDFIGKPSDSKIAFMRYENLSPMNEYGRHCFINENP